MNLARFSLCLFHYYIKPLVHPPRYVNGRIQLNVEWMDILEIIVPRRRGE